MSDKNIDKDIIEKLEIEKQKWINKIYGVGETRIDLMLDDVIRTIKNERNELETYKKIAEYLANTIHSGIFSYNDVCDKVSNEECNKRSCYQCIIDWSRNEVEKDE